MDLYIDAMDLFAVCQGYRVVQIANQFFLIATLIVVYTILIYFWRSFFNNVNPGIMNSPGSMVPPI